MTPRRLALAAFLGLAPLFLACSKKSAQPAPVKPAASAPREPSARFYYDLGPATVDVSGYPEKQRGNYKDFLSLCGTCHSAARPLNSPYVGLDTWKHYVRRMHVKMENRAILPSKDEEERILEFLVYDSQARKVDKSAEFSTQQEKLKKLFEGTPAMPR